MDNIERTDAGSEDYRVASAQASGAQAEAGSGAETQAEAMTPERPANATDAAVTFVEQIVVDAVDRMTTDRFVALEAVVDQQSALINELRDMVLHLYGQVEATHKLVATVIGVRPQPKPVKGE